VAACDNQPLVILFAKDAGGLAALEKSVAALARDKELIGRLVYVTTTNAKDLASIKGMSKDSALAIVQPETFGRSGQVLVQTAAIDSAALAGTLRAGLARHQRESKTFRAHVRRGQEKGVFWETATPVTDPMERRARQRGRKKEPRE